MKDNRVWTKEQEEKVAVLDTEHRQEMEELKISPYSKEAGDLWKAKYQKRMFEIFNKEEEKMFILYDDEGTMKEGTLAECKAEILNWISEQLEDHENDTEAVMTHLYSEDELMGMATYFRNEESDHIAHSGFTIKKIN
jgi:hypothetical protein